MSWQSFEIIITDVDQTYGIYTEHDHANEKVFTYTKEYEEERAIVILNFTQEDVVYDLPSEAGSLDKARGHIGNYPGGLPSIDGRNFSLRPYEAVVLVFQGS